MAFRVADIAENQPDSNGTPVLEIYGRSTGRYAVYRTAKRVMIQFADDDIEGANQRAALTPIARLRTDVEVLIDALRDDPSPGQQAKVARNEKRLGEALKTALQADLQQSLTILEEAKADMTEDRASDIRTRHLLYAAYATLALIVLSRILSGDWFGGAFGKFDPVVTEYYWTAAAVGAVGAFFSIVLSIRARTIPIDLQFWDNVTDAVLRVFVGATSAVLLIALLKANVVTIMIAGGKLGEGTNGIVLAAFVGGFAERLVSDFLAGAALGARSATTQATSSVMPGGPNERTLTGEEAKDPAGTARNSESASTSDAAVDPDENTPEPDEDQDEAGEPDDKQAVG